VVVDEPLVVDGVEDASVFFVSFDSVFEEDSEVDALEPFVDDDERESVMYQPLPLKTMPTGWMTLRNAPPHCSQVVSGGSEKLWRFSIMSSQAVHL
jgi:hypothetical protein